MLDEATLPVDPAVNGACDLLGIDPLYVANEGKVRRGRRRRSEADAALRRPARHPLGAATPPRSARSPPSPQGIVVLRTTFGGTRIVDMLVGDPLPRIC